MNSKCTTLAVKCHLMWSYIVALNVTICGYDKLHITECKEMDFLNFVTVYSIFV
jgi:hypothetical protein